MSNKRFSPMARGMTKIIIAYVATLIAFAAIDSIGGILYFAVLPGLDEGLIGGVAKAALQGAVLGFLCYATYDLTNYAILKVWSLKVTVFDLVWGTVLTGGSAAAGTWITGWAMQRFFPA